MTSLNETLANRFGQEVGRTVYNRLTGKDVNVLEPPYNPQHDTEDDDNDEDGAKAPFDARDFLHDTRHQTEQLLEQGKIEEAEPTWKSDAKP